MNRYRYLELLSEQIHDRLPEEEYNDVMQYYTEYFTEAGVEKEEEVMKELGGPQELAERIIGESQDKTVSSSTDKPVVKKGIPLGWFIAIAVIGSPIWFSLACAVLMVVIAAVCVILCIGIVAVAGIFSAAFLIVGGFAALFADGAEGLFAMGAGFIMAGIGIAALMLFMLIIQGILRLVKKNKGQGEVRA